MTSISGNDSDPTGSASLGSVPLFGLHGHELVTNALLVRFEIGEVQLRVSMAGMTWTSMTPAVRRCPVRVHPRRNRDEERHDRDCRLVAVKRAFVEVADQAGRDARALRAQIHGFASAAKDALGALEDRVRSAGDPAVR